MERGKFAVERLRCHEVNPWGKLRIQGGNGGKSGTAGQREAVEARPAARNEPESVAIPCQNDCNVDRFTLHILFWLLPEQGLGLLGMRATMRMGSRR